MRAFWTSTCFISKSLFDDEDIRIRFGFICCFLLFSLFLFFCLHRGIRVGFCSGKFLSELLERVIEFFNVCLVIEYPFDLI